MSPFGRAFGVPGLPTTTRSLKPRDPVASMMADVTEPSALAAFIDGVSMGAVGLRELVSLRSGPRLWGAVDQRTAAQPESPERVAGQRRHLRQRESVQAEPK
jgi:hypothetical protein